MPCSQTYPIYLPAAAGGLNFAINRGDGYSIGLEWDRAFPITYGRLVGYNIYYSTVYNNVFTDGVKFVDYVDGKLSDGYLSADIVDLTPGETYYFAVRAFEYDLDWYNSASLPPANGDLKIYPESILLFDITDSDDRIPISDIGLWPSYGIAKVGAELIRYSSVDTATNELVITSVGVDRGFLDTNVREHQTDGYDGVSMQDPVVRFWGGFEEENFRIQHETANFSYPNYAYTVADGYKTVSSDILTTDMSATDGQHMDFRKWIGSGWRRADLSMIVGGKCLDTYIGGEMYCADGYLGVGRMLRRIPMNEQSNMRLEELLEATGEPCVLLRRQRTGIRCSCFTPTMEYPEDRCPRCYSSGFVMGYSQFFSPRRSDGRILVRFGATDDDLKMNAAGLESEFIPECWTLVVPAIKDRDVILRYDELGNRVFAFEILNVTRNKMFLNEYGAQKFKAQRIRKTDPIYQIRAIDDTSEMPEYLSTSIGFLRAAGGGTTPHTHTVRISEHITAIAQINQTTSISADHNHAVVNGIVQEALSHDHEIIL